MQYTLVIFGGNGDLTYRKLLPAIYNLNHDQVLNNNVRIVAVGRRDYTNEKYHEEIYQALTKYSRFPVNLELWYKLKTKISYYQMDFLDEEKYPAFNSYLKTFMPEDEGKWIYYLAVAPEYFEKIVINLQKQGMHKTAKSWPRVVIEKPFGRNLASAKELNDKLVSVFTEEHIYRIDHYLGKEMLQNIMVIRFANALFEPLWGNKYIEQVQITVSETIGVESRGAYYDRSGAMRDMAQSHLLQLLCLIAMEQPQSLDANVIKDEKVKIVKALEVPRDERGRLALVRGQYEGYRSEAKVKSDSLTETFVAFKAYVNNSRWHKVPFYIRTGKKLASKTAEIIIEFKKQAKPLYPDKLAPNYLVIKIQPREGVFIQFNAKAPGTIQKIIPVQMDFCQNCQVGINSPEAYERLLYDITRGDATLFSRWDEVEASWEFVDKLREYWHQELPAFPNYKAGSWGPEEANELLKKDQHHWIDFSDFD